MKRNTLLVVLLVVVLLAAFVAGTSIVVWRLAKRTVQREVFTPAEKTVDVAAVVTQARELNRLETASMHVIHVGRVTQTYKLVPHAPAGGEIPVPPPRGGFPGVA